MQRAVRRRKIDPMSSGPVALFSGRATRSFKTSLGEVEMSEMEWGLTGWSGGGDTRFTDAEKLEEK